MESFFQTLRNLGPARLAAIAAVGLTLIGFFIFITSRLTTPSMELLYGEIQPSDAAAIGKKLDDLKIPYKVDPSGTRIMVPGDQVGKLRMQMALAGLPAGGSVGYEIFDKSEGFGTTSFIQNMNQQRAMEGELARTVATLGPVQQARVHLVLPKRELFARAQTKPTASVFLKLRGASPLTHEQIAAIQHLIASSVPNLEPNQISIVDDRGNLLARGMGADSDQFLQATADEKKVAYERRLVQTVEDLLGRSLGYGKVRAQVTADLDFDRITTSTDNFNPDQQVVRSTQTVNETGDSQDRDPLEPVTVNNNLPNANQGAARGSSPITSNRTNRAEETINYEIGRTQQTTVRETGQVRKLSVAVLVDGDYKPDPNGGPAIYTPRTKEEMDQINALVRSAIGFDAKRGDSLDVINMRFVSVEPEFGGQQDLLFGLPKEDLFRIAEMLVLGIVAVLVILLVVRPLITRAFERPAEIDAEMDKLLTDQSAMPAQLTGPGALGQDLALEAAQADEELEQMIDINRVEGRVRASSLRKVGEIVEKHPEEAVAILRSWLYQET